MSHRSDEELRKMHWRERYEHEAGRQYDMFSRYSEEQLVNRIDKNLLDPYFAIWRAIARKGTVSGSAMALWRFLERSPGKSRMLHRYHCAAALFQILGMPDPSSENELRKSVQWDSHGEEARQKALLDLKKIIEAQLMGDQQD